MPPLYSLAHNTLSEPNQQELDLLLPRLPELNYALNLAGSLDTMNAIQSTLNQLGLTSDTINLSLLLLELLGQQEASADLLQSLAGLYEP
ncbi:hypothetical protein ACNO5M_26970 [Vibrio owensii]|uniref:hypothetical protein n=1 Tax=Vibrio owensii TaxID=696485 RepID=UPI003AADF862